MSENLTATVQNARLVFGSEEALADFNSGSAGTFTMTSNSGGFVTSTATNDDTIDDTYTMAIYDRAGPTAPVASVGFTITDTTVGQSTVNFQTEAGFSFFVSDLKVVTDADALATATSSIEIRPDGGIYGKGNVGPTGSNGVQFIKIGTWHQSATTTGNFTVRAEIISGPTGTSIAQGSYGTDLSLSSTQSWSHQLRVRAPNSRFTSMQVRYTITDNADPTNTASQNIVFNGEVVYIGNAVETP